MTKEIFCRFYSLFTELVKQEVSGEYCMNASCQLIDHCGGYALELHPDCLMWGREMSLIQSLCDCMALSFEVRLWSGSLIIL